ncbi:MAG: ATP-binding protein, partial [Eubacterium sp.]|nr:ATP-binding protein [Eubacterium sp.]
MDDLKQILGNESIKNYFQSAIAHDRISHAYILEGEKGCGKKMLAAAFSKILQCQAGSGKPCGKCS